MARHSTKETGKREGEQYTKCVILKGKKR